MQGVRGRKRGFARKETEFKRVIIEQADKAGDRAEIRWRQLRSPETGLFFLPTLAEEPQETWADIFQEPKNILYGMVVLFCPVLRFSFLFFPLE
jgi:hypothetical protein